MKKRDQQFCSKKAGTLKYCASKNCAKNGKSNDTPRQSSFYVLCLLCQDIWHHYMKRLLFEFSVPCHQSFLFGIIRLNRPQKRSIHSVVFLFITLFTKSFVRHQDIKNRRKQFEKSGKNSVLQHLKVIQNDHYQMIIGLE